MTSVTVVGLGKIGLPLAVQMAGKGFRVHGADLSPRVTGLVAGGLVPFPGEPGLAERLGEVVAAGLLTATTDTTGAVAKSDVTIVLVPLITDAAGQPDYSAIDAATAAVAAGLRAGSLVSYETTLPVHTTRQRLGRLLPRARDYVRGATSTCATALSACQAGESSPTSGGTRN